MTTTKKTVRSASSASSSASSPSATSTSALPSPTAATPALAAPATPSQDPNVALAAYVLQTVSQLDTVEAGLGNDPVLTAAQKRHAARLRKGGAAVIAQIGNLAQQHQLESPALQVASMTSLMGKVQALAPLTNRLDAFVKHVSDITFTAQSAAWGTAMQFYALLQRRALTDSELAVSLAPVAQFMAYRHKPASTGPSTAPTKPQQKAITKALNTLKKSAPSMLAATASTASTASTATTAAFAAPEAVAATSGPGATPPPTMAAALTPATHS